MYVVGLIGLDFSLFFDVGKYFGFLFILISCLVNFFFKVSKDLKLNLVFDFICYKWRLSCMLSVGFINWLVFNIYICMYIINFFSFLGL